MHKHIILFFSVLVLLTACGGNTAPEGTIPEDRMVSLLTDVHLTDGALYTVPQISDSLYKFGTEKYAAVFKKYHTTGKQFTSSFKYYSAQPEQLVEIYTKVAANIQAKTDSLNKTSTPKSTPKNNNALPAK